MCPCAARLILCLSVSRLTIISAAILPDAGHYGRAGAPNLPPGELCRYRLGVRTCGGCQDGPLMGVLESPIESAVR